MAHRNGSKRHKKKAAFFTTEGGTRLGFLGAVCGKRNFSTHAAAKAAVKALLHSGQDRGSPAGMVLGSYYCELCSAWHIGHSRPWQTSRTRTLELPPRR